MEKNNRIILAVIAAVVVLVVVFVGVISIKSNSNSNVTSSQTSTQQTKADATERPIVKPTFYYFVTAKDSNHQESLAVFEKLKAEYSDRVEFVLQDMDADPSLADSFSLVVGQTPALIMLDTHNDPCSFLFATTDETKLKGAITKALGE